MIPEAALKKISDIVGADHLISAVENLAEYGTDATKLKFMPDAVAFPGKSEEISNILRLAMETGFPVVPRGAGSGMSGGALPVKGGLVISMNRLNSILLIDQDNLIARVEPGVITSHLQEAVEKVDLFIRRIQPV